MGIQYPGRKAGSGLGVSGLECSPRAHPLLHLARHKRHLFLPKLKRHLLGDSRTPSPIPTTSYRSLPSPWHSSQPQSLRH